MTLMMAVTIKIMACFGAWLSTCHICSLQVKIVSELEERAFPAARKRRQSSGSSKVTTDTPIITIIIDITIDLIGVVVIVIIIVAITIVFRLD